MAGRLLHSHEKAIGEQPLGFGEAEWVAVGCGTLARTRTRRWVLPFGHEASSSQLSIDRTERNHRARSTREEAIQGFCGRAKKMPRASEARDPWFPILGPIS